MMNPKYIGGQRLRIAIGDRIHELEALTPEEPSLQAVLAAAMVIEKITDIDFQIKIFKSERLVLRRNAIPRYHNLLIEEGMYVDNWMHGADMGEDHYDNFMLAVLGFCDPWQKDVHKLPAFQP
jgi:hypothetical protein